MNSDHRCQLHVPFSYEEFFSLISGNTFLLPRCWFASQQPSGRGNSSLNQVQQFHSSGNKDFSTLFCWIYLNTLKDENVLELHMHLKSGGVLVQIIAESFSLPFFLCRGQELSNTAVQAKANSI